IVGLLTARRRKGALPDSSGTPHANAAPTPRQAKRSYFDILAGYHIMPLTWPGQAGAENEKRLLRRVVVGRARGPTTRNCGEETMVAFALWRRCPAAVAASIGLLMAAIAAVAAAEQDRFPQPPIRLIVPFPSAGSYYLPPRLAPPALHKHL